MICNVWINNMPEETEKYIVARFDRNELWYWGSWRNETDAEKAAMQFKNGIVVERKET